MGNKRLRRHAIEAGLLEDYAALDSLKKPEEGSALLHDQLLEDRMMPNSHLQHLMSTKDEL